jgi:tetratricopeptide (TPR) repeat protein
MNSASSRVVGFCLLLLGCSTAGAAPQQASNEAPAQVELRRAYEAHKRQYGEDYPEVAADRDGLINALHDQFRYAELEPLLREALASAERTAGEDREFVLHYLDWLVAALEGVSPPNGTDAPAKPGGKVAARGKQRPPNWRPEAVELRRRAIEVEGLLHGKESSGLAERYFRLALLLIDLKRWPEARAALQRQLELEEMREGKESVEAASVLSRMAECLLKERRASEAEALLQRAVAINETYVKPLGLPSSQRDYHFSVAVHALGNDLHTLSEILENSGRKKEAVQLTRRALECNEINYAGWPSYLSMWIKHLAELLEATGQPAEAAVQYGRLIELRPATLEAAQSQVKLGLLLDSMGRTAEAEPLCRAGLEYQIRYQFQMKAAPSMLQPPRAALRKILSGLKWPKERIDRELEALTRRNARPPGDGVEQIVPSYEAF